MNKDKNIEERKYQIEMEIVDIKTIVSPLKILKSMKKNLKKMVINKIEGKTGEC